jgi:hypothetical protein
MHNNELIWILKGRRKYPLLYPNAMGYLTDYYKLPYVAGCLLFSAYAVLLRRNIPALWKVVVWIRYRGAGIGGGIRMAG